MGSSAASPANQPTYVEEPAFYVFNISLAGDASADDVSVNIDRDSDFLLTGLNGSSDGAYTLNFRLPSGREVSNTQIPNADLVGTANQPTAIGPPPIYRAGSSGPKVSMTEVSGDTNNIVLIFSGIRRVRTT